MMQAPWLQVCRLPAAYMWGRDETPEGNCVQHNCLDSFSKSADLPGSSFSMKRVRMKNNRGSTPLVHSFRQHILPYHVSGTGDT